MSALPPPVGARERLIHFEVGAVGYALAIADVLEVAEVSPAACVPTLARRCVGVVNHHGDALPIVTRSALFGLDEAALPAPQHLLVIASATAEAANLGLPVDRIVGLVDVPRSPAQGSDLVRERRSIDGSVVNVLATKRLLALAADVIERAVGRSDPIEGGLS